jgi:CubicO group peptidase (beta-lactamase class C family)
MLAEGRIVHPRGLIPMLAVAASCTSSASAQSSPTRAVTRDRIAAGVDSIAADALKGGQVAGMSIAVVRGRDTLVLKAYGKADLELDVPTPDRAVYEIGSVTKQFTATAILQLMEQGKLSLDDELTKYLPRYPMQGHRVTLRRLLDHTSGIFGYTEIPETQVINLRPAPHDSVVALFAAKPFAFEPGTAEVYSNSGYFLLGLIIEKVSGLPYEQYVQRNLFDRVGMRDSRYCSNSAVVPRRVHGYDFDEGRLTLPRYIDFSWPYAAGSLCSTVGDLVAWTRALHGGALLGPAAYHELITPGTLNDGTPLRYAKGIAADSVLGHRQIHHGGAIPGFTSEVAYLPDDTLTVVVLVNTAGPVTPEGTAQSIVRLALGDRSVAKAFRGHAAEYVGEYRGLGRGRELVLRVRADTANRLTLQFRDLPPASLVYTGGETFMVGSARYTFVREAGRVTKLHVDLIGHNSIATRQPVAERVASP